MIQTIILLSESVDLFSLSIYEAIELYPF